MACYMPIRLVIPAFLLTFWFALSCVAAGTLSGRVVAVSDGDTLTLLTADKQQVKVRLAEIDTPEKRQPFGSRSRQALADKVFGKDVTVVVREKDRYGRTVGRIYLDGRDINAELVAEGYAWVYRQYAKDQRLFQLEDEARALKRGLWALPEADRQPPWEWRRAQKSASEPTRDSQGPFVCGRKQYCSQMSSCEEARFSLNPCGLRRLDVDGDGVPCESLCR